MFVLVAIISSCNHSKSGEIKVASYNLRYDSDDDKKRGDGWETRLPVISNIIKYHDFEIFGTQEGLKHQLDALKATLPGYEYIGVGRDNGVDEGEHSAIFYDTHKFDVIESGDFWLSETPDVPSKGWDAVLPRICSWGHFKEKNTGFEFLFFNLHMDHVGKQARVESAYLVQQKMKELGSTLPAILTGDFNVDQTHSSYSALTESGALKDAYEIADLRYITNGTFNNFSPDSYSNSRIDHIFVSPELKIKKYGVLTDTYRSPKEVDSLMEGKACPDEIDIYNYRARVPSDHFPVAVVVEYGQ